MGVSRKLLPLVAMSLLIAPTLRTDEEETPQAVTDEPRPDKPTNMPGETNRQFAERLRAKEASDA